MLHGASVSDVSELIKDTVDKESGPAGQAVVGSGSSCDMQRDETFDKDLTLLHHTHAQSAPLARRGMPRSHCPDRCAGAGAAAAAKAAWRNHELPWYAANRRIGSPALRLHNEIVELTHLLKPTATEDEQRRDAHALLAGVVQEVFPGCTLEIFGSFATGLHLPTSDVDTVVLASAVPVGQEPLALRGLGRKLQPLPWVKDLEARRAPSLLCAELLAFMFAIMAHVFYEQKQEARFALVVLECNAVGACTTPSSQVRRT